ncbi:hypothetical protein AVEN_50474-1 [Araneus ventricosus]|uniref:Uncharacterized protein n=1 Tax=Araneus ventricosus TaxID=182803 RepID=A0A4Y2AQ34_ARAVE|nr:hypothetical protein AVEN_50474-1 [Araneus ventricosus]
MNILSFPPPSSPDLLNDEEFTVQVHSHSLAKQLEKESCKIKLNIKDKNKVQSATDAYIARVRKPEGSHQKRKKIETRSYGRRTEIDSRVRKIKTLSSNFCKYCRRKGHSEERCFKKNDSPQDKYFYTENSSSNCFTGSEGWFASSSVEITVTEVEWSLDFYGARASFDYAAPRHMLDYYQSRSSEVPHRFRSYYSHL